MSEWYETIEPRVGDEIKPDAWDEFKELRDGIPYVDRDFTGSDFRIESRFGLTPVNVEITGKKFTRRNTIRCRIEFVDDGEKSTYSSGWFTTNRKITPSV